MILKRRRINLLGGPDVGKSTTAADVFAAMKRERRSIEHVGEYVKSWAYQRRKVNPYDQPYLTGKQMQYEYRFLSSGVDLVVTDSPLLLSCVYAPTKEMSDALHSLIALYERDFPSINIFLNRSNRPYDSRGRYQDEKEAKRIDGEILTALDEAYARGAITHYTRVDFDDLPSILQHIREQIALPVNPFSPHRSVQPSTVKQCTECSAISSYGATVCYKCKSTLARFENRNLRLLTTNPCELEFTTRVHNFFFNANIKTLGWLSTKTREELMKYNNVGKHSIDQIEDKLTSMGLRLGQQIDPMLVLSLKLQDPILP